MQNGTILDKPGQAKTFPMKNVLLLAAFGILFGMLPSKAIAQVGSCAPGQKCYAYGGHPQYTKPGSDKKQDKTNKVWVRGHFGAGKKGKKQWIPGHWDAKR